ncbi:BrnA antitoxin family protein [Pseudomonas sp. 52 E 6]|uniref:BrnA antitoxin family protein n=1 Tax=Pseudomonas sp. 52 E 6 TaxID=1844106 RepID=UPI000812A857|nr:BrnA antitoxin family protein [Pseudomonas sp. 52 E 6]CRM56909.1 hypothetical protein [Pseudomonas sp. 52 E 6]
MTKKPSPEKVDTANPEWSSEDFAKAKPASEVLVGLFGKAQAKGMLKPKRGRPKSVATKEHVNVRFDADVLERFMASGPGWQTRMNAALADRRQDAHADELKA